MRVLECGDDIVFVMRSRVLAVPESEIVDDDWELWPASQVLPDRRSVRAEERQIETAW